MVKKIEEYSCYCTEKQTIKAFELGLPLRYIHCCQRESVQKAKKMLQNDNYPYYVAIDNFQKPGPYWCKVISIPMVGQVINYFIEKEMGTNDSLVKLIGLKGFNDGCLAFINECLNIVEEDD